MEYTLTLNFIEPFRLIEWHDAPDRENLRLRGFSFARWHKDREFGLGRPYITGTLIRSAVIRAVEEFLWLNNGKTGDVHCCQGEFTKARFYRELTEKRLRRRQTLVWDNNGVCNQDQPCPFCLLLGRYWQPGPGYSENNDVNFGNFSIPQKKKVLLNLEDIAEPRIINRVDQQSGKAEDFFEIREIDHRSCALFEGKISLSERAAENKALISLLNAALPLVNRISGALCYLTMEEVKVMDKSVNGGSDNLSGEAMELKKSDRPGEGSHFARHPIGAEHASYEKIKTSAGEVVNAFEESNKLVHLRVFSDVIRELRRHDPRKLNLPGGHEDRSGKITDHFLWDMKVESKPLRNWLPDKFNEFNEKHKLPWRIFCESLGQALFLEAKDKAPEQFTSARPLGAMVSTLESKEPEFLPGRSRQGPRYEWLMRGQLVAEVPFFFGWSVDKNDTDHISMRLLSARDGRLRLPRSALRGILRRDLNLAFGTNGCRAKLGLRRPCPCPVCNLLKNITIRDSLSDYKRPPQIRHRIRLDHRSGTVAKGALFDMEVGPTGAIFPFELRLRSTSDKFSKELEQVLLWWKQGLAFLSGAGGTGKGRFRLKELKCIFWDLQNDAGFAHYKETYGGRKKRISDDELIPWQVTSGDPVSEPPWTAWEINFLVCSPFLTKDPVESLLDPGGTDAVCYRAVYLGENGGIKKRYLLKGESFRGILRTAVGRRENSLLKEHEECDCVLCRLFGNEHEAGKIRVEDLLIQDEPKEKNLDRVAIDRFTGGARDKHKFDQKPLTGTPAFPLVLMGKIWIKNDLTDDDKAILKQALEDIRCGLYPFGGLGNVGFGWVNYLTCNSDFEQNFDSMNLCFSDKVKVENEPDKIYWPHYFIPFGPKVVRENKPPGHAYPKTEFHSGRLICSLKTLTPLIIPDGQPASQEANGHKSYNFFELSGELCIPGSEIKGMISSVYEALTNSCMRIFEEKKRLSWRMKAENLDQWSPGRITEEADELFVEEMEEIRLPLYDNPDLLPNIKKEGEKGFYRTKKIRDSNGRERLKKGQPTGTDSLINIHSAEIREFLKENKHLSSGQIPTKWFRCFPHPGKRGFDGLALLKIPKEWHNKNTSGWIAEGYVNLTGTNKVETRRSGKGISIRETSKDEQINIIHNEVTLEEKPVNSSKLGQVLRKRAIPKYVTYKNGYEYTMTKRCERIFIPLQKPTKHIVSRNVENKFLQLCEEYKQNAEKIPKVFRTRMPKNYKLNDGDLIYFRQELGEVVEIIPVRISRAVDDEVLGEKFVNDDFRPCVREILNRETEKKITSAGFKEVFHHHPKGLCPACAIFGTTFYKGRVSFGFAYLKNNETKLVENGAYITLPLLERPRPTWAMPTKDSKVPGRKFYVHHQGWKNIVEDSKNESTEKNENNRSVQAIDRNQVFLFEVRFENLRPWELGLLIYSLQLEPKLAHKLGMGKPLGFGSVKIKVENVTSSRQKDVNDNTLPEAVEKELKEIWGKETEPDFTRSLEGLYKALHYESKNGIQVRYPKLEKEKKDDPGEKPGYLELADGPFSTENRKEKLKEIWGNWA